MPEGLRWVGYITGNPWPAENEDEFWRMADLYRAAAADLRAVVAGHGAAPGLAEVRAEVRRAYSAGAGAGAGADAVAGAIADL